MDGQDRASEAEQQDSATESPKEQKLSTSDLDTDELLYSQSQAREVERGRSWLEAYLTPASIILAGLIIAAAIIISGSVFSDESPAISQAVVSEADSSVTLKATDLFKQYAKEIGLKTSDFNRCLDSGKYQEEVAQDAAEAIRLGVTGTPTFFINGKKLSGAQPLSVFAEVIERELKGSGSEDVSSYSEQLQSLARTQPPAFVAQSVRVSTDAVASRGSSSATVTVVEFSDYQCPFCARFVQQTLPQLNQLYGDRIRFVYRDLPLSSIHPHAQKAAEAARCAGEQEKYWEMHDKLFANQTTWGNAP